MRIRMLQGDTVAGFGFAQKHTLIDVPDEVGAALIDAEVAEVIPDDHEEVVRRSAEALEKAAQHQAQLDADAEVKQRIAEAALAASGKEVAAEEGEGSGDSETPRRSKAGRRSRAEA